MNVIAEFEEQDLDVQFEVAKELEDKIVKYESFQADCTQPLDAVNPHPLAPDDYDNLDIMKRIIGVDSDDVLFAMEIIDGKVVYCE